MGRCNIQHPVTKEWRCWSTYVDNWVTEWMDEESYKKWIIEDTIQTLKNDLEEYGIKECHYPRYQECIYKVALQEHCVKCENRYTEACDDCDYNVCVEYYISQGNDYFNLGICDKVSKE